MNTPPPPLQPIYEDTINALNEYFGPASSQTTNLRPLTQNCQTDASNFKLPNTYEILNLNLQEKKICNLNLDFRKLKFLISFDFKHSVEN